jgi:hypothetical protein
VISFRTTDTDLILQLQEALLADAAHVHQLLDLLAEDNRLNVYTGELEVRPPGAPTISSLWMGRPQSEAPCDRSEAARRRQTWRIAFEREYS